jgi:hypothetical protein
MKTLKHLCFIGIVILFALAMVSCDFVEKPDVPDNVVGYTEDGRAIISLTIATPGRALTQSQAQNGGIDYWEVVFHDNSPGADKYYRASWNWTQTGRINVPTGVTYSLAGGSAVLFGGRMSDKTLLAVGIIATGSATVTTSTTQISFNMTALTTDVQADPASSFKITGPAGYLTGTPIVPPATFPKAKVGNAEYPVFRIPVNAPANGAITATFAVGGITDNHKILVVEEGKVFLSTDIVESQALVSIPVIGGGIIAPASVTANILNDGTFNISGITTGNIIGYAKMAIAVPVSAISITEDVSGIGPIKWYIRGGMQNYLLDLGAASNSLGGAILLGVGNVNGYEIIPIWP